MERGGKKKMKKIKRNRKKKNKKKIKLRHLPIDFTNN